MRRTIVVLFVVVASLAAPLAITAVWLRDTVLDTNHYVAVVAPLSSNKAIDDAVAGEITDALLENVHLAGGSGFVAVTVNSGVRDYTQTLVAKFLATSEFRTLWVAANTQAQQALRAVLEGKPSPLVSPDGSVAIDLSNVVLAVRSQLAVAGLHVFDKLTPGPLHRRIVIARPATVSKAKRGVRALKAAAIGLPVLAAVCAALALLVSPGRRRTVFRLGAAVAATCLIGLVAISFARSYYLSDVVGTDVPQAAAKALYDAVVHDLRLWLELAALGGIVAAVVAALAGPSRAATRLRSRTLRTAGGLADGAVGESATVAWVADNKATLRTVVIVTGLLLLATAGHLSARYAVELAVGVLLVLGALEILGRPRRPVP